jgi:NAD(P)H-dependent FMN reductase
VEAEGVVLGLVGSPNRDGRTFQMVSAALEAAATVGATVELVQMADHVVAPCQDCQPWTCMTDLRCRYSDPAFEYLSDKLLTCGALVLGTPVYWFDTSAMLRCLIIKMFRVYARSAPLAGLPALGIGVAGGTGNGLVSGLRPLYNFFQMLQMRALDPQPVTRFNWGSAIARAREQGVLLAAMAGKRHPFEGLEERFLWYDDLPYLSMSRAAERRLLAALATEALPDGTLPDIARLLASADRLAAKGEILQSLKASTAVYEAAVKIFEGKRG